MRQTRLASSGLADAHALSKPRRRARRDEKRACAMRVLVIEDDRETAQFLQKAARGERPHAPILPPTARTGSSWPATATTTCWSSIACCRSRDGLTLIQTLRAEGDQTPVLILSALGDVDDRVKGLRAGGDDYLTKPLCLRRAVRAHRGAGPARRARGADDALCRRRPRARPPHRTRSRGPARRSLLQPREFRLLEYLMRNAGQVVTRTMLLENVWDYHFDPQTNVIDVHISRLRAKIDKGFDRPLLHTVRGAGYMIRDGAADGRAEQREMARCGQASLPRVPALSAGRLPRARRGIPRGSRTTAFRIAWSRWLRWRSPARSSSWRCSGRQRRCSAQAAEAMSSEGAGSAVARSAGSAALADAIDERGQRRRGHLYRLDRCQRREARRQPGRGRRALASARAGGGTFRYRRPMRATASRCEHLAVGVRRATARRLHARWSAATSSEQRDLARRAQTGCSSAPSGCSPWLGLGAGLAASRLHAAAASMR